MDARQEITNKIISMIENGGLEQMKRWGRGSGFSLPMNPSTGKAYSGANVFVLWMAAMLPSYLDRAERHTVPLGLWEESGACQIIAESNNTVPSVPTFHYGGREW